MVIMPDGEKIVLDEDESLAARNNGTISQEDADGAYRTLRELEETYVFNPENLARLTVYLKERFGLI